MDRELLFRGYIVENWFDSGSINKYKTLNKIIVRECIEFYNSKWKQRNEIYHSREKQHEFLLKWYRKTKVYAELIGGEAKKFIDKYEIDEKNTHPKQIKNWILKTQYYIKNQKEFKTNDIRKYFI